MTNNYYQQDGNENTEYNKTKNGSADKATGELYQEIENARKHLDNISRRVATLLDDNKTDPAATVTSEQCKEMNAYLEIEKPYDRWKLLTLFFARYQSDPELQRQLFSTFVIDHAISKCETEDWARAKQKYPEAYAEWESLVAQHQSAADVARFVSNKCSDGLHTAFLAIFNQMKICLDDKMVYLWAYFARNPVAVKEQVKVPEETLHRCPASMEWMYNDEYSDREFPDLVNPVDDAPDEAENRG